MAEMTSTVNGVRGVQETIIQATSLEASTLNEPALLSLCYNE